MAKMSPFNPEDSITSPKKTEQLRQKRRADALVRQREGMRQCSSWPTMHSHVPSSPPKLAHLMTVIPSFLRAALLLGLVVSLTGCFSSGAFLSGNVTDVQLTQGNYNIVATDVNGTASAGYIFGVSGGPGMSTGAIALARVSGDDNLYQTALSNLWENVRSRYGEVEGENLALVNVRYDVSALNLFVYTKPTLTVRADVVEFTD